MLCQLSYAGTPLAPAHFSKDHLPVWTGGDAREAPHPRRQETAPYSRRIESALGSPANALAKSAGVLILLASAAM
jgi:hypothetical protein